jgi:hypothetical protein
MPIRREVRELYPRDWPQISRRVRFERAGGVCQGCGRPHGLTVRYLPDGRWFDTTCQTWRNGHGRPALYRDPQMTSSEAGEGRATAVPAKLGIRRATLRDQLAYRERMVAAALDKTRPAAQAELAQRQQMAAAARAAIAELHEKQVAREREERALRPRQGRGYSVRR